jgi:peptidoglycan/xylan/chitin deacetylase (PgdA/CDA1 family)
MKFLPTRGVVTLVFDDGYERVYNNVLPVLDAHKLPGVFALPINGDKIDDLNVQKKPVRQPIRPWSDWLNIEKQGHEIASHSLTHPDLVTLSDEQLDLELAKPRQVLHAQTFVYPGGSHDERVVNKTKQHYKAARTVLRGFETIPPKDPWRLKTFNFSRNNFKVWKANMFALWAYLTNSWMIETYHLIHEDTSEMVHTVKTDEFARHMAFIARLPVAVKTIKEVIE